MCWNKRRRAGSWGQVPSVWTQGQPPKQKKKRNSLEKVTRTSYCIGHARHAVGGLRINELSRRFKPRTREEQWRDLPEKRAIPGKLSPAKWTRRQEWHKVNSQILKSHPGNSPHSEIKTPERSENSNHREHSAPHGGPVPKEKALLPSWDFCLLNIYVFFKL